MKKTNKKKKNKRLPFEITRSFSVLEFILQACFAQIVARKRTYPQHTHKNYFLWEFASSKL